MHQERPRVSYSTHLASPHQQLTPWPGLLDRQSLKAALLPRIKHLCTTTTLLSVRVNSLICIGKLLEHMDKWQVGSIDYLPPQPRYRSPPR